MTPTPQEMGSEPTMTKPLRRPLAGEEVVISGMSGIFPNSDSVQEFMENLYNKVDMVTTENPRWVFNHPEVPKHLGKVNGMGKFDAQFFRVHYKQAFTMEPMSRKLLEHAYGAIYDSGMNPLQLRGKKVGVFIGSTFSESEKIVIYENVQRNGFGITGCNKAMYANRISYWIDGKGPSYALDLACASSMACLEHAYRSISSGQCEAAIVGGCNLCMHPNVSLHCRRAGFVCLGGKTKCFDKNGDGAVRADAISVMFLQKAKDAKRIYSEVYHAKTSFSLASEQLLPVREPKELQQFLESFYSEIDVCPEDVEYIEANGAALPKADYNELKAIGKVFAKEKPIKIGCVKSNMGSSEAASGICALTKVCLAFHNGALSGNLHYEDPLDLPEIQDNKIQVLTDNSKFGRGFAALNSFSYSGANVHVLLKGHYKPKNTQRYQSSIPRLVLASGRQDNCVTKILSSLKKCSIDPEQISLLHNIHQYDIPGHMSRGYSLLDTNEKKETVSLAQSVGYYSGKNPPVWFVYSGMGSQWTTMGAELMRIPIFAAAIQKCHMVLEPKGIDIVRILTEPDKTIYDNILNSFVGIAAVQIGLTDILREMGIVPDNIIGHSVGELGCAYADGCFTAEEMILSAYSRGLVSVQTPFIYGSMAAVGRGYKDILPLCPPEIEVACHNSSESSTISGPAEVMKQFVSELTSQGVFAKEVPCSNIAYHSRYIAKAGPALLKYLSEVIKTPKTRSEKWVSTSVPQDKWDTPMAKYSSAEYHTNNLLNSVLFEETAKLIPSDALVIEVAPHGLLQAILKRSLSECVHVPLTKRGVNDPVKFLLEAIGKLYQAGLNPKIDLLYPKIEYPVSTGTPLLSQLVDWEHSEEWSQAKYSNKDRVVATLRDFVMSIQDEDYKYFKGHVRNGNYVFPEAAYLVIAWETFAMYKGVNYRNMPVVFKNVQFHGEAIINPEQPLRLQAMILKASNKFEVSYQNATIASGFIFQCKSDERVPKNLQHSERNGDDVILTAKDIYTMMRIRGYNYKDEFQSLQSLTTNRNKAFIQCTDNWITHLDSLFQFNSLARDFDGVSVPLLIQKLRIDVNMHKEADRLLLNEVTCLDANIFTNFEHTRCGGIEIDGLVFKDNPIVDQNPDVLLTETFVPNFVAGVVTMKTAIQVDLQIVCENLSKDSVQIVDFIEENVCELSSTITEVAKELYHEFDIQKNKNMLSLKHASFVITDNILADEKKLSEIYQSVQDNTFVLTLEKDTTIIQPQYELFSVITALSVKKNILVLLKKYNEVAHQNVTYMPIVHDPKFSWILQLQAELKKQNKVILVSERQPYCGLIGMVKKLRQEYGDKIGLMVVDDYTVPTFNPLKEVFRDQIKKNMAINILKRGKWGGYYKISSEAKTKIENIYLTSTISGDANALSWSEIPTLQSSKNLVQTRYAGTSILDAEMAAGKTKLVKQGFGMDFSGIKSSGEKVMGLVSGGSLASSIESDPDLLWPVPKHWTLEEAATVPLAYAHAYYCLAIKHKLRREENVLITNGFEPLGQAIIAICLSVDCNIFVSVSDVRQKKFLTRMFPALKEDQIGLAEMVTPNAVSNMKNEYNTKELQNSSLIPQCSIIINCLSGPGRKDVLKYLAFRGTFIDTCAHDMTKNEDFGMRIVALATSYVAAHFNTIFRQEYTHEKKIIQTLVCDGIAKGVVRPLCRIVYALPDVTRAFRLLASNKHTGKILMKTNSSENRNQTFSANGRITCLPEACYVVICDGTELSVEFADRLVQRGARKLVIHMKPSLIAGYCYTQFMSWKKLNVSITISSENLQTEKGCLNLLKEGAKLGSIQGIFIVQNFNKSSDSWEPEDVSTQFKNTAGVVANLDLISRNVCNKLDHFVIINYASQKVSDEYVCAAIDKICRSRHDICLPALVFRIGAIKELGDSGNIESKIQPLPLSAVFNALESSLKLKHNNVISYNLKKDGASEFLQKISRIIGVNDILELDEGLTLKDLMLNEINIEEINATIRNTYQISYLNDKLERTTIRSLKNLGPNLLRAGYSNTSGLGAFFTYIDQDECAAAEPIVTMATSYSGFKEEEDLDPKATYVMLVPGFDGHHQIFTTVSERLKVQAMTFQLMPDTPSDSITQIAANTMNFMKKRMEMKSKFYLLGYSFGVNVALELARMFEKEGHFGVVYCLDSSPDALRAQLDAYIGNLTDSQLQNAIVEHMYELMAGQSSIELKQALNITESWNEKVEMCVNKLRGLVKYSHQYKRCLLNSAYKRIKLAREYVPDFKLDSEIVLIKGIPHPNLKELPEDFNLSSYSRKKVKVFDIESDHVTAHQDCRVSNIVNTLLEPKLLEEYRTKNLLLTYLADPPKTW